MPMLFLLFTFITFVGAETRTVGTKVFHSTEKVPLTLLEAKNLAISQNKNYELSETRIPENFSQNGGGCAHTPLCAIVLPFYFGNWAKWQLSPKHTKIKTIDSEFVYDAEDSTLLKTQSHTAVKLSINGEFYLIKEDRDFFLDYPELVKIYNERIQEEKNPEKQNVLITEALLFGGESYFDHIFQLVKKNSLQDEALNAVYSVYCYSSKISFDKKCHSLMKSVETEIGIKSARTWIESFWKLPEDKQASIGNKAFDSVTEGALKSLCKRKIELSGIPIIGNQTDEELLLVEINSLVLSEKKNQKENHQKLVAINSKCENVDNKNLIAKYLLLK